MVTCSEDILEEYNISIKIKENTKKISFENQLENMIYDTLLLESFTIDELVKKM